MLAAQRGREISSISPPGWYAGQLTRCLAPLQQLKCCPVLLATDLDDFRIGAIHRYSVRRFLLHGDKQERKLHSGHGLDPVDVVRRLDVVAEVRNGT